MQHTNLSGWRLMLRRITFVPKNESERHFTDTLNWLLPIMADKWTDDEILQLLRSTFTEDSHENNASS